MEHICIEFELMRHYRGAKYWSVYRCITLLCLTCRAGGRLTCSCEISLCNVALTNIDSTIVILLRGANHLGVTVVWPIGYVSREEQSTTYHQAYSCSPPRHRCSLVIFPTPFKLEIVISDVTRLFFLLIALISRYIAYYFNRSLTRFLTHIIKD